MYVKKSRRIVPTFKKSNGRKQSISIKNPAVDKSPAEIRTAMELLTTLDIFEKDGVNHFSEVSTCKYVDKLETILFDEKYPIETGPADLFP